MSHQHRETLTLQGRRFTSTRALVREIIALLQDSDYKLVIEVAPPEFPWLVLELDGVRTMGRVKVEKVDA